MDKDVGFIQWIGIAAGKCADMNIERIRRIDEQHTELEMVSGMSVDQIIELFKKGCRFEEPDYVMREYENQMEMIRLMQENAELRKKNKKLRRRINRLGFGGNKV